MSRLWAIVSKDLLEVFRARGTYYYIPAMLVMSTYFFINYFNLAKMLDRQNATPDEIYLASRSFLNTIAYLIPVLYCLFAANMTSAGFIFEKQKRSLESLLVTPVSVRRVWIGKALGASLSASIIGIVVGVFAYLVIALAEVYPQIHRAIAPDGLAFLSGLVLVPTTVFLVCLIVTYIQLVATNPRMGNLVYGVVLIFVWGGLFFASYFLPLWGFTISYYPLILLGLILVLAAVCGLFSRRLSKEKVVLSSKG
jgi:ABC-2 type transport system permease protein